MRRRVRARRGCWAVVLGTTLAWPGTAVAAEPDGTESDAPPADPSASEPLPADTAKAKALYEKGKAAFDTTDYPAAIEAWTEAYSTLSDTPANAPVKAALIYNLATAQERAFGIDQDLTHLRRAEDLMEAYSRSIPALYGDGDEAQTEQSKIDQRLAQVRKTIEQAEAEARAEAERKAAEDAAQAGERDDSGGTTDAPPPDPKARIFIITGAALLGAGVAGLGVMGAGLALGNQADSDVPENLDDRRAQFDRGRAGNTMAYVGAGVGGAFVVAGAVLLGLGLHKRRATVSASLGPGQAGLLVRGRF